MRRNQVAACATAAVFAVLTTTTITAPAAAAESADYAALGDSYSSGTGTREYFDSSGDCLRGPHAYPQLWAQSHAHNSFSFVACSGAKTSDVDSSQLGALSSGTSLVTLSVGGNDIGFSSTVRDCLLRNDDGCDRAVDEAEGRIRSELPGKLDSTYAKIRKAAPKATVVVVGYPRLNAMGDCGIPGYSETKRKRINSAADVLAGVISGRVSHAGFKFADTRSAFNGHGVCAGHEWINGPSNPLRESFHPNVDGHRQGFLPAVNSITG